jgi:hypothetical protein
VRRFKSRWGEVEIFTDEPVPDPLVSHAALAAQLGARFRPARFRPARLHVDRPERRALRTSFPYIAVWPSDLPLPSGDSEESLTAEDMAGVVLAESPIHTCFVCRERFQVIYPETGLPFFSAHLNAHQTISGCPSCGTDFTRSRIQGLALLPPPSTEV